MSEVDPKPIIHYEIPDYPPLTEEQIQKVYSLGKPIMDLFYEKEISVIFETLNVLMESLFDCVKRWQIKPEEMGYTILGGKKEMTTTELAIEELKSRLNKERK